MRAFIFVVFLLMPFGVFADDSGNDVMGVKIKRFGREGSEGRASIEDHNRGFEGSNSYYRRSRPSRNPLSSPAQAPSHPLGEGLVYPKRKPITFW